MELSGLFNIRGRMMESRFSGSLIIRMMVVLVALGLVALSAVEQIRWNQDRERIAELVRSSKLESRWPELVRQVEREADPDWARLGIARAFLSEAADYSVFSRLPQSEAIAALTSLDERLEWARDFAAKALWERPSVWQFAYVLGASKYLLWLRRGDARLVDKMETWLRPLQVAIELAPGENEARRFLMGAYLKLWRWIPAGPLREDAKDALRRGLAEPELFDEYAPLWFKVARNFAEARSIVPKRLEVWRKLEEIGERERDWALHREARRQVLGLLDAEFEDKLGQAKSALETGDAMTTRNLLALLLKQTPRNVTSAQRYTQIFQIFPPGSLPPASLNLIEGILDWALERCLWGTCFLSPSTMQRMAGLLPRLDFTKRGMVLLTKSRYSEAEMLESAAGRLRSEEWMRYRLFKARSLVALGASDRALKELADLRPPWSDSLLTQVTVKEAARLAGDSARELEAERALRKALAERWPLSAWKWGKVGAQLAVWPPSGRYILVVALDRIPAGGGVVDFLWDGLPLGSAVAKEGVETFRFDVQIEDGLHLLELVYVAGARIRPGDVWLEKRE